MGYAVQFRDATGAAKLEDAESLDAALERVEQLRNQDGASDVRVFREVPIEVKTYYKVVAVEKDDAAAGPVVGAPTPVGSEPPPGAMPLSPPPVHVRAAVVDDEGDPVEVEEDNGLADSARRSTLFSRG